MANDLTTTDPTSSKGLSLAWQLPKSLQSVVESSDPVAMLPICSPDAAARLRSVIAAEDQRPKADRGLIRRNLTVMSTALAQRRQSEAEAKAQLDLFEAALSETMPADIFEQACAEWAQRNRFMPTPADIITHHAMRYRAWRLMRMGAIIDRHDREWSAPVADLVEPIPDDEVATWPASYRQTALNKEWITQAQFDAANAAAIDQAA